MKRHTIPTQKLVYVCTTLFFMLAFYEFNQMFPAVRERRVYSSNSVIKSSQVRNLPPVPSNNQVEKQHRKLMNNDKDFLTIIGMLKKMNKPALVTVINDAYIPFVHNWLCNTMHMNIHQQVFVIATDKKSRDKIAATWPNIKVHGLSGEGFHGNQDYSHAGYVRIMVKRTQLILQILENKVEMLLFDLDTFWKTNPMPLILRSVEGHDVAAVPVSNQHHVVGGGFIFMKPTENMIKLWKRVTEMMMSVDKRIKDLEDDKKVPESQNDQVFVSSLLSSKYAGIKLALLSLTDFPDGLWYGWNASVKKRPYLVVHNNWIIGNNEKMMRAKKFKQWFWDSKNSRCDVDLVKQQTGSL